MENNKEEENMNDDEQGEEAELEEIKEDPVVASGEFS